jgi:hypothetical protein
MMSVAGAQARSRAFREISFAKAGEPKETVGVLSAGHGDRLDRVGLIPFATLTKLLKDNLQ